MKPTNPKKRTRTNLKGEKVTIEKNNGIFDKVKTTTKKDGSQVIKTRLKRKNMYGQDGSTTLQKNKIVRSTLSTGNSLKLEPSSREKLKQVGGLNRIFGSKIKTKTTSYIDPNTMDLVEVEKIKRKNNAFSRPKKNTIETRRDAYSRDILGKRLIKSNKKTK